MTQEATATDVYREISIVIELPAGAQVDRRQQEAEIVARAIERKAARLDQEDLFAVLGVERGASRTRVRNAYRLLARWFDPARLEPLGLGGLRPLAMHIMSRLVHAHTVLSHHARKRAYLESLPQQQFPAEPRRHAA